MERSQTSWGTWDPRNDTEVSFLGFLFASYIPRPRDEEANNLETPTDAYKKSPKDLLPLAKELGKVQPGKCFRK